MSGTIFGIVYCITNNVNGKKYVGQTIRPLKERWWNHGNRHHLKKMLIGNAILKYGRKSFSICVLEECLSYEELNSKEEEWISRLNTLTPNGYNVAPGGHHRPMPPQHYEAIAKKLRGMKRTDEFCQNLSRKLKGRTFTQEWKLRISEAMKGKKMLPHVRKALDDGYRAALAVRTPEERYAMCGGENNGNSKLAKEQVEQIRELYVTGRYKQRELGEIYGVNQTNISSIVRGTKWKVMEEEALGYSYEEEREEYEQFSLGHHRLC